MNNVIFIPINVPSSKNNKQIVRRGKRTFLINGKLTTRYIKNTAHVWRLHKSEFLNMINGLNKPYIVGFHFVRDSERKFDFINACQTTQDIMTSVGWISDDNLDVMFPVPFHIDGKWYSVDKDKPGVYVKVFTRMELSEIYSPTNRIPRMGDYAWFGDSAEYKKTLELANKKLKSYNSLTMANDLVKNGVVKIMTAKEYNKKYGKNER